MNPIKSIDLARLLHVNKSAISHAIKGRNGNKPKLKTIEIDGEILVDTDDEFNKKYIIESCTKRDIPIPSFKGEKQIIQTTNEEKDSEPDFTQEQKELLNLAEEKKKWEIEKLKQSTRKEKLQVEKLSGNLLPIDETSHVLNFVVSNFTGSVRSHVTSFLSLIVKELGGTDEDYKKYMDQFDEGMVEFAENAIEEIASGLDGVVEQYQEVRGRGERK